MPKLPSADPTTDPAEPAATIPEGPDKQAFLAEVTARLGHGWSWTPSPGHGGNAAFLHGPGDLRLLMAAGDPTAHRAADRTQVMVRLDLDEASHRHLPAGTPFPHLRLPVTRSAASVADSIRKRLLPAATAVVAATEAIKREHEYRARHLDRLVATVAALLGDGVRVKPTGSVAAGRVGDPVVIHGQIGTGDAADRALFTLDVPVEIAPLVAELAGRLIALTPSSNPTSAPDEAQNGS